MNAVAPVPAQRAQLWGWMVAMVGAGALQAASLAWPSNGQPLWWLQLLSLSVLCVGVQRARSAKQVSWLVGLFATTWLTATFWWLFISMHTYGGLPAPLAVVAVLALAAFWVALRSCALAVEALGTTGLARRHAVCRVLDVGGVGARHAVDRLPLGRSGLRPCGGASVGLATLVRCVWHWVGGCSLGYGRGAVADFVVPKTAVGGRRLGWRLGMVRCRLESAAGPNV